MINYQVSEWNVEINFENQRVKQYKLEKKCFLLEKAKQNKANEHLNLNLFLATKQVFSSSSFSYRILYLFVSFIVNISRSCRQQ